MSWTRRIMAAAFALAAALSLVGGAGAQDEPVSVALDVSNPIAPGTTATATITTTVDEFFVVLQCETGTDLCEERAYVSTDGGSGSASVIIRRHLLGAGGGADCGVDPCEIRVLESGAVPAASVPIEIDTTVPITRPTITLTPADDLLDRQEVVISGTGYDSFVSVVFRQCTLWQCAPTSASGFSGETGDLDDPARLVLARSIGTIDCADGGCFVLGAPRRNADHLAGALLRFDPDAPPAEPATATATPTEDLLDGQGLSIEGIGWLPGEYVGIATCLMGDGGLGSCGRSLYHEVGEDGSFSTAVPASRRVGLVDCVDVGCVLVLTGELDRVEIPIAFDASVPPPPIPTLTVEPSVGLVDHQVVTATIADLAPGSYVSFEQCVVGTGPCRGGDFHEASSGPLVVPVAVVRDIQGGDCAVLECELAARIFGADSIRLTAPLGFDPDGPRADPPELRVLPATGLLDGQRVEVRVENMLPGDFSIVAQCRGVDDVLGCGFRDYFSPGLGPLRFSVDATPDFDDGPADCRIEACSIVLFDERGEVVDAEPLSFAEGTAGAGGYPVQLECIAWPTTEWETGDAPTGVDPDDLDAAIAGILASDTDAVVVIHGGRLVAEGYDRAMSATSINYSASVSKTFTGTVIGMLVDEGLLDLDAPAPVPEWSDPDDERHDITLRHLMNMAAGLEWDENYSFGADNDILTMLASFDAANYAASKPLEVEPGTRFHYSTGTTQILAGIISRTLDLYGDDLRSELDARLFDVLGITEELELDGQGAWLGGAFTSMTTRDFAKFGLLHLRGGVWEGEQLVSRDWIEFMHEPSPASAGYAGQIWRRGGFVEMVGLFGQKVTVRPDLDLVVASNTPIGGGGAGTGPIVALFEAAAPPSCSDDPVLEDDTATTQATVPVMVDVLANDPGRGGAVRPDTLTVYDRPAHGLAEVVGARIRYTPGAGFNGVDQFSYLVCTDAPFCGVAAVTVTVEPWGISLAHGSELDPDVALRMRVSAADAPPGSSLAPLEALAVAVDCASGEPFGSAGPASLSIGGRDDQVVRWLLADSGGGCHRLLMTFRDGSAQIVEARVPDPKDGSTPG